MNKNILKKRKMTVYANKRIKFIIKHQNKLHKRYYSENVPKKYRLVSVLRAMLCSLPAHNCETAGLHRLATDH